MASVGASVWDSVWASVGESKIEYNYFAENGSIRDYGWVSFYDFFTKIGIINNDKFNQFKDTLLSGIYDMVQLEGYCIVSNMPERIERLNGKLHCDHDSAIKFRDGYELFYWKGVNIPGFWIKSPEQITSEVIINEKNAEKRRCLFEILGAEKFAELLGVYVIDQDVDQYKNSIKLYRTKQKDEIADEFIQFARVVCPSTMREYFLCVPETLNNVWDAVAWTFGKTKNTYQPIIET